jgi:hypothetical protein
MINVVIPAVIGSVIDAPINITDDDFLITNVSRIRTGIFSVRFTDTGSDRARENDYVNDDIWFGPYGQLTMPWELPTPLPVMAKSTVTLKLRNGIAGPNTVNIGLIGYKKLALPASA